ncbi:hypothetical protein BJ508DRAFT_322592 [Ascobolus immersus RN42]|uniref:Uncharacterized protein n=1 Tax=Ascobolus immersus RN42 TaxID=1160509 RepID=A0A3N4IHD0_ASCIM|nr:hypothetical protein BJ508DRAFT_322592 [Ascobolus immersus RN42]
MCLRVVERYAVCGCIYYVHGVDQCRQFGMLGHEVEDKVVLVGHSCQAHLATAYPEYYQQHDQTPHHTQQPETQATYHATTTAQYSTQSQTSADYSDYYNTSSYGVLPDNLPSQYGGAQASTTQPLAIGGRSYAFQGQYDSYQYSTGSSR